ncbi:MAG: hypothetical protein GF384_04125, partial [Elusimicrobia bacterium]|nr:hypothetical protein [Elusimicrobiota bacterium]
MKIVLVITPQFYLIDVFRTAPLGILYIAAILKKNNYDVHIQDLRHATGNYIESIE